MKRLTDEQLRERMAALEESDLDAAERAAFAERLAEFQRGPAAEEAVREIVDGLPEEQLAPLIAKHVMTDQALPSVAYGRPDWSSMVADRLTERGFNPVDSEQGHWRVGWQGGDLLQGRQLGRIALLAVWLREMRGGT